MIYDIKPIPTDYGGVTFRSRLEARWAAWFDRWKIEWEYEPFDLEGWAPDFLLKSYALPADCSGGWAPIDILVEVKPVELRREEINPRLHDKGASALQAIQKLYGPIFDKAVGHSKKHQVMLCGTRPVDVVGGVLLAAPEHLWHDSVYDRMTIYRSLGVLNRDAEVRGRWNAAGLLVQHNQFE